MVVTDVRVHRASVHEINKKKKTTTIIIIRRMCASAESGEMFNILKIEY